MQTLNEILKEAGYRAEYTNRSYYYKTVNNVLQSGDISLIVVPKGFVRTSYSGFKYNFKVSFDLSKRARVVKTNGDIEPEEILKEIAKLINTPEIKEAMQKLKKEDNNACECGKCGGKGYILAFRHICKGVCFDCLGIGYKFKR